MTERYREPDTCCSIVTNGIHTDIVLKAYSNRVVLIVTQFKKLGTFLTITRESATNSSTNDLFTIKTVFGSDTFYNHSAARYIAQKIDIKEPLLLSIALKDFNLQTLRDIVAAVNQIKVYL